jgi:dihydrodipicolinate synthase/N-acetylneuraminate lyase
MFTGHSFDFLKVLDGGGAGSICPLAALMPKTALALHAAHARGDRAAAEAAQKRFFEGLAILMQEKAASGEAWGTPHGGVKAALAALGIIGSGRMREPQPMPTEAKRREIAEVAARVAEL